MGFYAQEDNLSHICDGRMCLPFTLVELGEIETIL